MKTIQEIRHYKFTRLIQEGNFTLAQVARRLGKQYPQVWQWSSRSVAKSNGLHRSIGSTSARLIEEKFDKEIGWMDSLSD